MRRIITILALGLVSTAALADSAATSSTESAATSAAQNMGNAQSIQFNSTGAERQTVKSAPGIGGQAFYGSFSGDSCMVSGGGGVSIVGFGAQMATPVEDRHCNMRRNFERVMQASAMAKDPERAGRLATAAVDILCQAGEETRLALVGQGLCSDAVRPQPAARQDWENMYSPG